MEVYSILFCNLFIAALTILKWSNASIFVESGDISKDVFIIGDTPFVPVVSVIMYLMKK